MKLFRRLSLFTTLMTFALITIGAVVRVTKSGLGCGTDWPDCHGQLVPSLHTATVAIEYSHRITAAIVGILILAVAIVAWLRARANRAVFWPSVLTLLFFPVQAWIGRQVVKGELQSLDVVLHFLVSVSLLGLLVLATVNARTGRAGKWSIYTLHGIVASVVSFAVLVLGAFVSQFDAALAFPDWPLMEGSALPGLDGFLQTIHFAHRVAALALGITLIHLAIRVTRLRPKNPGMLKLGHGLFGLWVLQAAIGGANVLTRSAGWAVVVHVALAAAMWAGAIAFTVIAYRSIGEPVPRETGGAGGGARAIEKVKAYFFLTKPRIIELLLITTVPAMVLAERGWPSWGLIAATLLGGALTAGSANSINCFYDRDIDEKMERTSSRPLPSHKVEPRAALVFGLVLGTTGFAWLLLLVNLASALLATSAILFYVFVYTIWMKRSTPSNIVIGGAAGAVPALVGWAAVTGGLDMPAWIMFAVIFFWTPPHFWALAIRYSDDYAKAGVPMLPVVRGRTETKRQMLLYSVILLAVSLFLYPAAGMGIVYLVSAAMLGVSFILYCIRLMFRDEPRDAMGLFHFSITYLVLLFVAIAVDPMVHLAAPSLAAPVGVIATVLFALGEGALLVTALRRPATGRRVVAEIMWTSLPVVVAAALLLISLKSGTLASP